MWKNIIISLLFLIGLSLIYSGYNKKPEEIHTKHTKRSLAVVENGECSRVDGVLICDIEYSFVVGPTKYLGKYRGPAFEGISSIKGGSVTASYNQDDPTDNTLYKPKDNVTKNYNIYIGSVFLIFCFFVYLLF